MHVCVCACMRRARWVWYACGRCGGGPRRGEAEGKEGNQGDRRDNGRGNNTSHMPNIFGACVWVVYMLVCNAVAMPHCVVHCFAKLGGKVAEAVTLCRYAMLNGQSICRQPLVKALTRQYDEATAAFISDLIKFFLMLY